jgi:cell division septum initiation protein DivIVA
MPPPDGQVTELSPNRTESDLSGQIKALEDHIETLKGLLIAEVERTQTARDEAQEARAEADAAKSDQVRMARDVTVMFEDLRAMADRYAELHADRGRLRAELEQARRRWWHRWFKR